MTRTTLLLATFAAATAFIAPRQIQAQYDEKAAGNCQADHDPRLRRRFASDNTYSYLTGVRLPSREECMFGTEGTYQAAQGLGASAGSFVFKLRPMGGITEVPTEECAVTLQLLELSKEGYLALKPAEYVVSRGYQRSQFEASDSNLRPAYQLPTCEGPVISGVPGPQQAGNVWCCFRQSSSPV